MATPTMADSARGVVDAAVGPEPLQEALGGPEDAAPSDVLPHDDDAPVALHLLVHRVAYSLDHGLLGHRYPLLSST